MASEIHYAKTVAGVSIAYCVQGEGPPLVHMPTSISDIAAESSMEELRIWHERMSRTHTVVRYDARGTGSSDRDSLLDSVEAWHDDLDAVVRAIGIDRFDILAVGAAVPGAITYAARHAPHVSSLILWSGFARARDRHTRGGFTSVRPLLEHDWRAYTNAWAHTAFGWSDPERGRAWARLYRHATSSDNIQALLRSQETIDLTNVLPEVSARTLVVSHRTEGMSSAVRSEAARFMATEISNARLVVRDGFQVPPWADPAGAEGTAALIDEFTGVAPPPEELPSNQHDPGLGTSLTVVLFTDIASSTPLTQKLGDSAAQEVRRTHNDIVRAALAPHAGNEIKHTGDGIMASFSSASSALEAAIAIQRGVAEHKQANPDSPLAVYVGLNAGEPIAEEGDLFGTSINLAARICDQAEPGQILASDVVRQLAAGKDFVFSDLGETALRGFEDPVKLWELRWRED